MVHAVVYVDNMLRKHAIASTGINTSIGVCASNAARYTNPYKRTPFTNVSPFSSATSVTLRVHTADRDTGPLGVTFAQSQHHD